MKKRNVIALLLLVLLLVSGCADKKPKTETYIIPKSYWDYAGSTLEEAVESFHKLGGDYYTEVKELEDGVQLELTEEQRDNLIRRNDEYHDRIIAEFKSYSDEYRFEPDETYQTVNLYFDEKLPPATNIKTVFMLTAGYGMNYILKNNTTDWNVEFCIYNCHTNKLVVSANIPDEEASCGPEEWKASYNE